MKFNHVLNNFSSGQWSSKMLSNVELEQYKKACKTLENCIVLKEGGAFKRPGLKYIDLGARQSVLGSGDHRLFPIVGRDGSTRKVYIMYTTLNAPNTDWFVYDIDTGATIGASATVPGNRAYSNLKEAHYAQVNDKLYVAIPDGSMPFEAYVYNGVFIVDAYVNLNNFNDFYNVPFNDPNVVGLGNPQTITSSAAVGVVTLTASSAFFITGMVGAFIKLTSAGSTGVAYITAIPGPPNTPQLTCTALVLVTVPVAACGITAGTSWEISAWNDYYGWPTKVTAFEQRLFWGGKYIGSTGATDHNKVWGSRSGDVEDMMEIPLAQDPDFTAYASDNSRPFSFVPAAATGGVQILTATKVLAIGYSDREIVARGTTGALGPLDITIDNSSSFGAAAVQPIPIDNNALYAQAGKNSVRQLIFSYENEQYKSIDVGFYSDISEGTRYSCSRLSHGSFAGTSLLFSLMKGDSVTESILPVASIDEQNQVGAWGRITPGGTSVFIIDIVSTPAIDGFKKETFALIRRTINGSSAVYLEKFARIFEKSSYSGTDMFYYLDSYKEVASPGSATITGATHLVGETIHVFGDGNYLGTKVVNGSGEFTVDAIYTNLVYGLGYTSKIIPAPIRTNTQFGNSQGNVHKVNALYIKFWNTIGATYGDPERSEYYDIQFRQNTVVASTSIPLFNGEKRVQFPPGQSREKQIEIKSTLPFPCNVLSVTADGVAYD